MKANVDVFICKPGSADPCINGGLESWPLTPLFADLPMAMGSMAWDPFD